MTPADNYRSDYSVLVAVRDASDLPLISLACHLARARDGGVCVFTVSVADTPPAWLKLPESCTDIPVEIVVRADKSISQAILREIQQRDTDLLVLGWEGRRSQDSHVLGETLDPVVQQAACDVILMRGECAADIRRVLIPAAGGPNAPEGLAVARELAPNAEVTALYVAVEKLGPTIASRGSSDPRSGLDRRSRPSKLRCTETT